MCSLRADDAVSSQPFGVLEVLNGFQREQAEGAIDPEVGMDACVVEFRL